ncbi:MAG: hypothetical protein RDV48_06860 [Candidatus Eremiobacteraeota bacterium]|nr:hypothetical protein [Candidatus Eremiobacteraeota bacterium]
MYSFTIDGQEAQASVTKVGSSFDRPEPGDMLQMGGFFMTLGEPGEYRFIFRREEGILYRELPGGQVVPAVITAGLGPQRDRVRELVTRFPRGTGRPLAGIMFSSWEPCLEELFRLADPNHTLLAFNVLEPPLRLLPFPSLPVPLRSLFLSHSSCRAFMDFHALGDLRDLLYFHIDNYAGADFDLAYLQGCCNLRHLEAYGNLKGFEAMRHFTRLLILSIGECRGLVDIPWAAHLDNLEECDLWADSISDISALSGHRKLKGLTVTNKGSLKLPLNSIPSLREIRIRENPLSSRDESTFRRLNPHCRIVYSWGSLLKSAIRDATQIIISESFNEGPPVAVNDPFQVSEAIAMIEIDEQRSNFHCMCMGTCQIQFLREGRCLASVTMHHGQSLRWDGWEGDGMLTAESGLALSRWLAGHGHRQALEELELSMAQERARIFILKSQYELMPPGVEGALSCAASEEQAAAVLGSIPGDLLSRALLFFKLLGVHENSWNLTFGFEGIILEKLLPSIDRASLSGAVAEAAGDPLALKGAARWILGDQQYGKRWESIDEAALTAVIPGLAMSALSHPRKVSRYIAFLNLEALGSGQAINAIRQVLRDEVPLRHIRKEEETEPGGMAAFHTEHREMDLNCSDRAYAALVLARLGDRASLPLIRHHAGREQGNDFKVLMEALVLLEGRAPGR